MRKIFFTVMLFSVMLLSACNATAEMPEVTPTLAPTWTPVQEVAATPTLMPTVVPTQMPVENQNILFEEHQLYAVAYLGYETIEDISYYQENYLEEEDIPQYYFSGGEYYLIIPRYGDMRVCLYRNDLETMGKSLVQESDNGKPFVVQCNISDIFPDVTVELTYQGETVEFSPYISLKDGSIQVGDRGLNITRKNPTEDGWISLTEDEIKWFNEQFFNTEEEIKRNNFLNCTYTDVRNISIYEVFYNWSEEITAEERQALRDSEIDFGTDFFKLTAVYMDSILSEHMNVSFEEIDKADLDRYLYLEEFDAYFDCHGDTNYSSVEVKNGEKDGNGNVKLQYLLREDGKEYIVTLKKHANGYYFVSNCEME